MKKNEVLIVCALEIETQDKLNDWEPFADDPVWDVLYTGVGKVNAAFKLTQKFGKYGSHIPYNLVINYGTAGSRKLPIGELVDCTKFTQRDMDVSGMGFMKGQTPFENDIPFVLDYDHVEFNPIGKKLRCGTGDNFVQTNEDTYSDIFDMEAYALAKVCHYYDVPFISFKYITDGADEQAHEDWEKNLIDGIQKFKKKVLVSLS